MDRNDDEPINKDNRRTDTASTDDGDLTGQFCDCDNSNKRPKSEPTASDPSSPRLFSRVLVAWLELTVVGITGGMLGAAVDGPAGLIIYLITALFTVGIIFYNVNELVKEWVTTITDT